MRWWEGAAQATWAAPPSKTARAPEQPHTNRGTGKGRCGGCVAEGDGRRAAGEDGEEVRVRVDCAGAWVRGGACVGGREQPFEPPCPADGSLPGGTALSIRAAPPPRRPPPTHITISYNRRRPERGAACQEATDPHRGRLEVFSLCLPSWLLLLCAPCTASLTPRTATQHRRPSPTRLLNDRDSLLRAAMVAGIEAEAESIEGGGYRGPIAAGPAGLEPAAWSPIGALCWPLGGAPKVPTRASYHIRPS